jgi:hypothetical protein
MLTKVYLPFYWKAAQNNAAVLFATGLATMFIANTNAT